MYLVVAKEMCVGHVTCSHMTQSSHMTDHVTDHMTYITDHMTFITDHMTDHVTQTSYC